MAAAANAAVFMLRSSRAASQLLRPRLTAGAVSLTRCMGECSGVEEESPATATSQRLIRISKAMKAYLEKAKARDEFMKDKIQEFEMGKRHLANMMGWDPERITQDDIDSAIRYLLPSGLMHVTSRPIMKHPEEVYPKAKAAMFDYEGRPFHYLFYTGKPLFFEILSGIHSTFMELNRFEDSMIARGILIPPPEGTVDLAGSEWIKFMALKAQLMERITEKEHEYMIEALERLAQHPYSARAKDFFMKYRTPLVAVTKSMEYPPLTYEEGTNRPYADAEGLRKHCVAKVRVYGNGSGKFSVNGQDLRYWYHVYQREQLLFPLQFTGMTFKVDVEATVTGVGESAQAGAVRHGIALALRSFVTPDMVENMRLAGLLTKDRRVCERKKPGKWAARRGWTWRKR